MNINIKRFILFVIKDNNMTMNIKIKSVFIHFLNQKKEEINEFARFFGYS